MNKCIWVLISEMRSILAICLILVCFVDKSYGTFGEFMTNLPTEVAHAFSNAWTSISDVVHKPVRLRRPGSRGKLKSTPSYPLGSSSPRGYKGIEGNKHLFRPGVTLPASVTFPSGISQSTRFFGNKLIIPVLPKPTFKNLEEWRELQKAHYAKRKKVANPAPIIIYVDTPQKATKDKKANTKAVPIQYGDDSFATMMVFP